MDFLGKVLGWCILVGVALPCVCFFLMIVLALLVRA